MGSGHGGRQVSQMKKIIIKLVRDGMGSSRGPPMDGCGRWLTNAGGEGMGLVGGWGMVDGRSHIG